VRAWLRGGIVVYGQVAAAAAVMTQTQPPSLLLLLLLLHLKDHHNVAGCGDALAPPPRGLKLHQHSQRLPSVL